MERKIKGLEDHVKFLCDIIEEKETEIDNLKDALNVVNDKCKRLSAAKSSDDEAIDNLEKENEEQRVKIRCLRKHRDEILNRHEITVEDYEKEFQFKEEDIKHLQDISKQMKIEIDDLKQEIVEKDERLKIKAAESLKSSNSSLHDEIAKVESN